LKVLLAHCFYRSSAPSGEDSVYLSEKELLESNGVDVIPLEKYNDCVNVTTFMNKVKTAKNTIWSKSAYDEISQLIKHFKPDVAHFHNTFPQLSPSAYKACYDNGVPVVQTLHNYRNICPGAMLLRNGKSCELCLNGSIFPINSLMHKCYRNSISATAPLALMIANSRLNGAYKNYVTRYIALTEFAKDRFIRGGLESNKIAIKPNFLSIDSEAELVKGNYAVFVGRLSDEKGIRTLLTSWSEVTNLKLKILGDGHLRSVLEEYAAKSGIDVEFMGFLPQKNVIKIVRKAMIQIIPSECYEGFPMSVLEAFACGTPVIASRLGSLQEIVTDGDTGVLFEAANSSDLAEKINALIKNSEKRMRISFNAKNVFDVKYSNDKNLDILMNIYNVSIEEMKAKS